MQLLVILSYANSLEYIPKYETFGHDLAEEELEKYYKSNDFRICSIAPEQSKELDPDNVENALNSAHPGYSNWTVTYKNDVSCKSLGVPSEAQPI